MHPQLRVALINRLDMRDVRVLSGIPHFMMKALERQSVSVTALGPTKSTWMKLGRCLNGAARMVKRRYDWTHSLAGSRELGKKYSAYLKTSDFDVIFAPVASTEIAHLETSLPIVYLTDMTFRAGVSYYDSLTNLLPFTTAEGDTIEKLAVRKAARVVVPSEWAAKSLADDYHRNPDTIDIVAYGANLDDPPSQEEALSARNLEPCKLLLLGVNWERKGGPLALAILQSLLSAGIKAELLVCGCEPPPGVVHPSMRVLPFLNKNKPEEARQLRHLLLTSTFLLLPSLSEAWGVVFGEASACGLPSVTRHTGGIPSVVRNGINGLCLPAEASAEEFSAQIIEFLNNPGRYRSLQISSRNEYETRLNWDVWASRMIEIFTSVRNSAIHSPLQVNHP